MRTRLDIVDALCDVLPPGRYRYLLQLWGYRLCDRLPGGWRNRVHRPRP